MSRKRAMMALFGGQAVIVDAVQAKPEEREALTELRPGSASLWLGFGSRPGPSSSGRGWRRAAAMSPTRALRGR